MKIFSRIITILGVCLLIGVAILNYMAGAGYLAALAVVMMVCIIVSSIRIDIWKRKSKFKWNSLNGVKQEIKTD